MAIIYVGAISLEINGVDIEVVNDFCGKVSDELILGAQEPFEISIPVVFRQDTFEQKLKVLELQHIGFNGMVN